MVQRSQAEQKAFEAERFQTMVLDQRIVSSWLVQHFEVIDA